MIVGPNDGGLPRAIERALGLIHVGGRNNRPQVFKRQSIRRQRRWIGLNPHGRPLPATYADESHARELGNLLRKPGVGKILDLRERKGLRGERQCENGRIGRVGFAVDRRRRQTRWQISLSGIDGRLHFLFGDIDIEPEPELQRDDGTAARTSRRHLFEARHLSELALQWRRDG